MVSYKIAYKSFYKFEMTVPKFIKIEMIEKVMIVIAKKEW